MRIVVAPDDFKGSLTAGAAARAIADGWCQVAPDDELDLCPLSDGGPGFVDTLAGALGGELIPATIRGPLGSPTPGAVLMVGDVAYVESAQACGLHLLAEGDRNPGLTTTFGVGELLRLAIESGARRVVVGLGGSGTNDGGAGMLAALGATADVPLDEGGLVLRSVTRVDLSGVYESLGDVAGGRVAGDRVAGGRVELLAATDVDNPLLGLSGASKVFGAQKGADDNLVLQLDAALESFSRAIGRRPNGKDPAVALGSGAAGGLGYGLMCVGAARVPGIATVIAATRLEERIRAGDLVITGEGLFDWQSLRGKVVSGVAAVTMPTARPCVVIAGDVLVGRREFSALGVSSAYSVADVVGSVEASLADPVGALTMTAARVARTWSH